ncbi:MAG: hypothetical protein ACI9R3_000264 [Verrucomicrobiales bacterium]|jgi:hypothetical protein
MVEEIHLDRATVDELLDGLGAQRPNPIDSFDVSDRVDLLLGQHSPVSNQDEAFDPELLLHLGDLR